MNDTGERMIPEITDSQSLQEHVYRYYFAKEFAVGRRVLDIACGEGYGSYALKMAGAHSVIGMDISDEACRHARDKYSIDARVADAMSIPLTEKSIDLVVSFETIEHVPRPLAFIQECSRILSDSGVLVISTPNVETYNPSRSVEANPFHCSEMTITEFTKLLNSHFESVRHLFYDCDFASRLWQKIRLDNRYDHLLDRNIVYGLAPCSRSQKDGRRNWSSVYAAALSSIWKARNKAKFQNLIPSHFSLLSSYTHHFITFKSLVERRVSN